MTGWVAVAAVLATVVNGVAAGIMLSTVIGIVPLMRALPYPGYVRMVQFMRPRYDPIMPLSNGGALVLDVVLVVAGDRATAAHLTAAVLLAVVIAISVGKNVPVNRWVMSLDADRPPPDWAESDPRRRWQMWNTVRTACAVVAFGCNAAALAW